MSFYRALQEKPYAFDFYQSLRRTECLNPDKPRLGEALRPIDEPLRLSQEPSLAFAPSALASYQPAAEDRPARLEVRFLGLIGPNGPLPLHLTEYARDRLLHAGDPTFHRFLDIFHHRIITLFYRAWAQAQPVVSLDRPNEDRFVKYVGALFGLGAPGLRNREAMPDYAKLFHAGLLARQIRNRDGLKALLAGFFRLPVRIEEYIGHYLRLPVDERTRLGRNRRSATLGRGAVLGASVWDRQHKFRICLGPLSLEQYERFLPGGSALPALVAWVRHYLCFELEWDVQLVLSKAEVPETHLGQYGRLGWTTWLGRRSASTDAADLIVDAERLMQTC